VIASTRRRWRREQKLAILAEVDAPSGSVSGVARRHALHTSLLFRWRRALMRRRPSAPVSPAQGFVPVRLPPPSVQAPPTLARPGTIEVVLVGGRTIRIGADVDTVALLRIVEPLEARRAWLSSRGRPTHAVATSSARTPTSSL
jgi:transposase